MTVQPTREQLRALADAATPGPWEVHGSLIGIGRAKPDFGQTWGLRWRQDIEFICAARTAIPQLLDQLDRAEHRIARLEAQTDIRGRAVVMYRERAREAEARVKAVRAIHRDLYESMSGVPYCDECDRAWPCPTIRALDGDA